VEGTWCLREGQRGFFVGDPHHGELRDVVIPDAEVQLGSLAGVELLVGEKKPRAKLPSSDTMVAPGESGLPGMILSSDAHGHGASRRRRRPAV